jgi:hypothetical protein
LVGLLQPLFPLFDKMFTATVSITILCPEPLPH